MAGRDKVFCGKCGQALREGVRFCEKCGARVTPSASGPAPAQPAPGPPAAPGPVRVRLCTNCGSSVTSNSKTCKWCGTALKAGGDTGPRPLA